MISDLVQPKVIIIPLWFSQPKNYSEDLQEDQKIRDCVKNYIQKNTYFIMKSSILYIKFVAHKDYMFKCNNKQQYTLSYICENLKKIN